MKNKIIHGLTVFFTTIAILSILSTCLAATDTSTPAPSPPVRTQTISTASVTGSGWFFCNGHRDSFSVSVMKGVVRPDGWNYAPRGYANYQIKLLSHVTTGQVNSLRIWRYRVDPIDGGTRAVMVGLAQIRVAGDVRNNWWFRITLRSMENGQNGFMIQLWRPIGADKLGGWSFSDFDAAKPATLKLNSAPFYQMQGILKAGNISIQQ
jgi:hypothetical protein